MLFYDSIEIAPSNVMVLHIVAKFATKRNYEFDVDYDACVARLILSSVRERELEEQRPCFSHPSN